MYINIQNRRNDIAPEVTPAKARSDQDLKAEETLNDSRANRKKLLTIVATKKKRRPAKPVNPRIPQAQPAKMDTKLRLQLHNRSETS